jgi:hypothetical protein
MIDQFSFQRIHVHVMQFFNSFFQTPNIEIVKTALPESRRGSSPGAKSKFNWFVGAPFLRRRRRETRCFKT